MMRKEISLLIIFLGILLLSGCIQTGRQTGKTETEFSGLGYGLAVRIGADPSVATPEAPIVIRLELKNNGDFDTTVKSVKILGQTAFVSGELSKNPNMKILKGTSNIILFDGLTVNKFAAGETLTFYPAICYTYNTSARAALYITSEYQIFSNYTSKTIEQTSSKSPITISFVGSSPIFLATNKTGTYKSEAVFIQITPRSKGGKTWPVADCINNPTEKIINTYNVAIYFPTDVSGIVIKNGGTYFENCDNAYLSGSDFVVNDISLGKVTCTVKDTYKRYYMGSGFQPIPLQLTYEKSEPIQLDQIVIEVFMSYDYYEMLDMASVSINVMKIG